MTSRDFCYWLQGFFEIHASAQQSYPPSLDPSQTDAVKRHLALVFKHEIDPSAGGPEQQKVLNQIHEATKTDPGGRPPQIGGTGPDGQVYRC
jgi:hypothetical protein